MRKLSFKLRRMNSSRMLFSLAICSFAFVGFGALAYVLSIPSVLMNSPVDIPIISSIINGGSGEENGAGSSTEDGLGDGANAFANGPSFGDGLSADMTSLAGGPIAPSTQTPDGDSATSDSDSQSPSGSNPPSGTPDTPSPDTPSPDNPQISSGGLSNEVEAAIHAHLIACYANLKPYYDEVCAGFENLYSTMNSYDPNVTHVSCSPTNASALLSKCDQGRIAIDSYRYNGEPVLGESKWRSEAQKLSNCFNDLTNACSALRTVNGFTVAHAPIVLANHLNSNGEVRYLVDCRERAATIHL